MELQPTVESFYFVFIKFCGFNKKKDWHLKLMDVKLLVNTFGHYFT